MSNLSTELLHLVNGGFVTQEGADNLLEELGDNECPEVFVSRVSYNEFLGRFHAIVRSERFHSDNPMVLLREVVATVRHNAWESDQHWREVETFYN